MIPLRNHHEGNGKATHNLPSHSHFLSFSKARMETTKAKNETIKARTEKITKQISAIDISKIARRITYGKSMG